LACSTTESASASSAGIEPSIGFELGTVTRASTWIPRRLPAASLIAVAITCSS
jgi:hypothetical protein